MMRPCPIRSSSGSNLGELVRWVESELKRLQPVSTPGMLTNVSPNGTSRVPLRPQGAAAIAKVERLFLSGENAKSLICARVSDEDAIFFVAKPEGFYSDGDSDGQLVVPYTLTLTPTEVAAGSSGSFPGRWDVRGVEFPINLTDLFSPTAYQVLTPSYRNGFSIIYAMLLAEPLDLDGYICTHIDLNIGDVRRWETMRVNIESPNYTAYPNSFAP